MRALLKRLEGLKVMLHKSEGEKPETGNGRKGEWLNRKGRKAARGSRADEGDHEQLQSDTRRCSTSLPLPQNLTTNH